MSSHQVTLILIVVLSIACSGAVLWTIRDRKNPRWLDISASILLLLISAFFLGITQAMLPLLPAKTFNERDLITQYQIALLVIPFFTANLATSMMAHAILSDRDYSGQLSALEALKPLGLAMLKALFLLTPIAWVMYLYYKIMVKPHEA